MGGPEVGTAWGAGTSQEGEALALVTYVEALPQKEGVVWIFTNFEAADIEDSRRGGGGAE